MPIAAYDRVRESTTTTGTGTITLAGVAAGPYQSFAVVGNGNQCVYCIADQSGVGNDWEVGIGTYSTTGPSLARNTVTGSSNSGNLVNFPAGVKDVFVVYSAARSVDLGDVGTAPNQIPLNQYLGKLAFMDVLDTISNNPYYDTQISDVEPTLNLDFVNSKTLDSRITFTRSTTATYYDGKSSAVAEQNLLLQSQTLATSPWTFSSGGTGVTSVTQNSATAPDGTTTANLLLAANTSASHFIYSTVILTSGIAYTYSVYAKAGTNNYLQLNFGGDPAYANFDLSAGTVGTSASCTASIVNAGSGWYRCIVGAVTPTANRNPEINIANSASMAVNASWSAAGTETIYAWGAQLEQRASATAYNATTTAALTNYIPALQTAPNNVARLDYNPITGTPNGLLIEEARTNLATYSSAIGGTNWSTARTTVALNQNIAPDGSLTVTIVTEDTNTNSHGVYQAYSPTTATNYSLTFYMKAKTRTFGFISFYGGINDCTIFNLSNGTITFNGSNITSSSASITPVGNGWYRCTTTLLTTSASGFNFQVGPTNSGSAISYTGDGLSGIYIWGAQLEAGAFPTSYIPTVASQVTRALDNAQITGANLNGFYNIAQGSWFASYTAKATSIFPRIVGMNSGKTPLYYTASSLVAGLYDGGAAIVTANGATSNSIAKMSSSWVGTTGALCLNGGSVATGNQPNGYSTITFVSIGSDQAGSQFLNSTIQKISYYPIALSNAELQEMTS